MTSFYYSIVKKTAESIGQGAFRDQIAHIKSAILQSAAQGDTSVTVSIGSINIDFLKRSLPGFECQAINKSTLWIGWTKYNQWNCQFDFYDDVTSVTMHQQRIQFDQFCKTVMKAITKAAEQGQQQVIVEYPADYEKLYDCIIAELPERFEGFTLQTKLKSVGIFWEASIEPAK